jgi:exodeoxyribonuclease V gamma subunit
MLELHRDGRPMTQIKAVARAGGALPHGQVGECVFAGARDRVTRFAGRLGRVLPRRETEPLELDLALGEFRLIGRVTGLTATGWVGYRLASMKAGDYLNLWLHHLAINAAVPAGAAWTSHWVAEDRDVLLEPIADPAVHLAALLDLYWQGTRRVLHFFPKSALAYVEKQRAGQGEDEALRAARQIWEGSDFQTTPSESTDVYYQMAFRDTDPLDAEFTATAATVFAPLFAQIPRKTGDGLAADG